MQMNHAVSPGAPLDAAEAETRDRILAAAHRVFLRRGTAKARTQEIAEEAGVNKALLHYYYGTKAALADTVFAHHIGRLLPTLFGILGDPDLDIPAKVRAVVREHLAFHRANPYVAGFLATEIHAEPDRIRRLVTAHGTPPLAALERQLADGAARGEYRPIPARQVVLTVMGALMMPFIMRPVLGSFFGLDGEAFDRFLDERADVLPGFLLAGLRP